MTRGIIDLHLHTTRSDGVMTPAELVMYAKYKGLCAIAITDHDTVSGNEEACLEGHRQGLKVVPGVELSIQHSPGELHLLGYFVDYDQPGLKAALYELREHRKRRNPQIIEKLRNLDIPLDLQEIRRAARNGNVGRPHIAAAMVNGGHVGSIKEAFDRYLRKGGPAYVPKEILTPTEGIQLIRDHGGLPVLAHPNTLEIHESRDLPPLLEELKRQGLAGLEVYHPGVPGGLADRLERLADHLGLLKTGGSDFHGLDLRSPHPEQGRALARLPYRLLEAMERCLPADNPYLRPDFPHRHLWMP